MNTCTLKDFYDDPALRRRLMEKARRERWAALKAGFALLRGHLTPRLDAADWIGRLG